MNEGIQVRVKKRKSVRISFQYVGVGRHRDRHQIEFWITAAVRLCRHLVGRDIRPIHVQIAHHRNFRKSEIEKFVGVKIEAGADIDEIDFPAADWNLPIASTDHYLHDVLVQYCEDALARRKIKPGSLRVLVEDTAAELLPHGQAHSKRSQLRLAWVREHWRGDWLLMDCRLPNR